MFLKAELGWLPGFPIGKQRGIVKWVSVPSDGNQGPKQIELDRQQLHRAGYNYTKLVCHFPRVLPRLVETVEWWKQGVSNILGWLNDAIHKGKSLPVSLLTEENHYSPGAIKLAGQLATDNPKLRHFVATLSWVHYLSPRDFGNALRWARDNAATIALLGDAMQGTEGILEPLVLWELVRRDGTRLVQPLIRFFGERRSYTCPTHGSEEFRNRLRFLLGELREHKRLEELPVLPRPDLTEHLRRFSQWLIQQDEGTRRRALGLLDLVLSLSLLDPWERWWTSCGDAIKRIRTLEAARPFLETSQLKELKGRIHQVNQTVNRLAAVFPPQIHIDSVIECVQSTSLPSRKSFHQAVVTNMRLLPESNRKVFTRAAFLWHWCRLETVHGSKLTEYLREFRSYQQTYAEHERLLGPWTYNFEEWEDPNLRRWLPTDPVMDQHQWRAAFKALARFAEGYEDPLTFDEAEWICVLAPFSRSAEETCERFRALCAAQLTRPWHSWESLISFTSRLSTSADDFAKLFGILDKSEATQSLDTQDLIKLQTKLERAGWTTLLRTAILGGKAKDVVYLHHLTKVFSALSHAIAPPPAPSDPTVPEWAAAYPTDVRRALVCLNAATPDAQALGARILKDVFPDSGRVQEEIEAIEKQIRLRPADDRLKVRLANLTRRQAVVSSPRESQIHKAIERIDRATCSAVLSTWRAKLEAELASAVRSMLKIDGGVSWLFETKHLQAWFSALELTGSTKALALDLFRRRCQPPPWSLHDHPANRAFLKKMKAQGLDMAPWLESGKAWEWKTRNGLRLTVRFEEDPLEIFQMGAYFDTCLSPGSFNFFSVFANAADVNKKVLFARDQRNLVVGRCLLALSDAGGILVFRPYCHDFEAGFAQYVNSLAADLAKHMGTIVVPRGSISTLVSTDWYDDGPQDLCDRFTCLHENSEFRRALPTVELTSLRALIDEAFDPLPVNSLSLSLILDLSEFEERPELVLPLLRDIEQAHGLAEELWHRVVSRLHRVGAQEAARRMLRQHLVPIVQKQRWLNIKIGQTIAAIDPSMAVRLVRQTRERGVRRDEDESVEGRREILATAYRLLGREKKAAALMPKEPFT
jgi:hypothetical protein